MATQSRRLGRRIGIYFLAYSALWCLPIEALLTAGLVRVGAITGMLLIARRRVVSLVVALLVAGGLVLGWIGALVLPG